MDAKSVNPTVIFGTILVAALAALFTVVQAKAKIPETRQAELMNLLKHDCGSCHGLTRKGGLGSPLKPANVAHRSDVELLSVILDGVPGTPMPPWRPLLTEQEIRWLIEALRTGSGLP